MHLFDWYQIASNIFSHNFSFASVPFKYFLVVTKSCGSRCTNCLIWQETPQNELTLTEFELLAVKSKKNLMWLNLSGGEPTDREDLIEIIDTFIKNCPNLKMINFTSNGLNPERLQAVCEYLDRSHIPVIGINVSVDGPPLLHNRLRGTEDGYAKAIEALKIVRRFKRIKSAAAMTLFPANYLSIPETIESIAASIPGFTLKDLHLNFPHTSSHYYGNERINYSERINIEKIIPYFKNTSSLMSPFELIEGMYQKHLLEYSRTGKTSVTCAAIKSNIYISEKGDVYPCTIWDKKLGSLREFDFDLASLLKSQAVLQARQQVLAKNCPNCWTPCEAFPSLVTDIKHALLP